GGGPVWRGRCREGAGGGAGSARRAGGAPRPWAAGRRPTRRGGGGSNNEPAAPEERHVAPPGILRPDPQAVAHALPRGGERAVAVHDRLRLRRRAGGEEDGGDVGRRHTLLDGVEEPVVRPPPHLLPALPAPPSPPA